MGLERTVFGVFFPLILLGDGKLSAIKVTQRCTCVYFLRVPLRSSPEFVIWYFLLRNNSLTKYVQDVRQLLKERLFEFPGENELKFIGFLITSVYFSI